MGRTGCSRAVKTRLFWGFGGVFGEKRERVRFESPSPSKSSKLAELRPIKQRKKSCRGERHPEGLLN